MENAPATLSPVCGARDMCGRSYAPGTWATPSAQVKTLLLRRAVLVCKTVGSTRSVSA